MPRKHMHLEILVVERSSRRSIVDDFVALGELEDRLNSMLSVFSLP